MEKIDAIIQSFSHLALNDIHIISEQLREAYASYRPSFMELKVPFNFQGDLDALTDKDLGTLFHEYVHYLQNISTPWGLYASMAEYAEMVDVYRAIQEASDEINIPIIPNSSEHFKHQKELLLHGDGFNPFAENRYWKIDRNTKIIARRSLETVSERKLPTIYCKVKLDDGSDKEFILGAKIIKESMAGMMQQLIDPTATHEKDDIPYNVVRILCEDMFPEVAKDPVKMITDCYLALYSLSPAEVLFDELDKANRNPRMSAKDLVDSFMEDSTATMNGIKYKVYEFYGKLKDAFLSVLEKTLTFEAKYVREALSRVDVSQGYIPVLSILYDGITREKVCAVMNGIGFPWLWTEDGIVNSRLMNEDVLSSADVNMLVCHNAIFSYLHHPNKWCCCPLRHLCLKSETIRNEDCLENKPWEGKGCVMAGMANWLGLDDKTIRFK